jgi:hypothetical protein
MKSASWLAAIALLGFGPGPLWAAAYNINCGNGGPSSAVQQILTQIGSSAPNTVNVTGTCVGDLSITGASQLTISGLVMTGNLYIDSSTILSLGNLQLTGGTLSLTNSHRVTVGSALINGYVTVNKVSQISFSSLTMASWTDSGGQHDPGIDCLSESDCSISALYISGSGTSAGTGLAGVDVASEGRLVVYGGTITGFDIGVQVWNNAIALLTPMCTSLNIQANLTTGVFVSDGGIAKLEGLSSADAAASGCSSSGPSIVNVSRNGTYGLLADGGGNAYLYEAAVSGHAIDGIRAQHGSIVRVRSSTIDAATSSGRSARLKAQAHLYFDEQSKGPAAKSTLAGPVCVTGSATVDTDNSSTVVTVTTSCSSP